MKHSTIYALIDPSTDEVRYVGATTQVPARRLYAHIDGAKKHLYHRHVTAWIRSLLDRGISPELIIIDEGQWSTAEMIERENLAISTMENAGYRLTNHIRGGQSTGAWRGHARTNGPLTVEHRKKIGNALRGRTRPGYAALMKGRKRKKYRVDTSPEATARHRERAQKAARTKAERYGHKLHCSSEVI